MGHRQAVRHQTLTLTFPGFESLCPSQTQKDAIASFFCVWLGHRTLPSSLCEREARSRMGFAFAARRSTSSLVRRRACESSPQGKYPCAEVFRTTHPPQAVPLPSQGKALIPPQFPANALQSPRFYAILISERRWGYVLGRFL